MASITFGRDAHGRIAAFVDGISGVPGGTVIVAMDLEKAMSEWDTLSDLITDEPANRNAYRGDDE